MYQFVITQGVPLPFTIHSQYPKCAIPLETSSSVEIRQHHESIMLIMMDEDSEIEGNFGILDQLSDKVIFHCIASYYCVTIHDQDYRATGSMDSSCAKTTTSVSLDVYGKENK